MKRLLFGAAIAIAVCGCGGSEADINKVNKFLTDLSEVHFGEFAGPNPDNSLKIDFAVKRLLIDSPEAFQKDGDNLSIPAAKVHEMSDRYFNYPIDSDESSNEADFENGNYVVMPMQDQQFSFSKAAFVSQRADTILYDVDVFNCNAGWKGSIASTPQQWAEQDPANIPEKYKTIRAVLLCKDGGFRLVSYMVK